MYRFSGVLSGLLPVLTLSLLTGCPGDASTGGKTDDSTGGGDSTSVSDDQDGDGFGADDDCDDGDDAINPDAEELCDGIDNDCSGEADDGLIETVYTDSDGDGFGDPGTAQDTCETDGLVDNGDDCDDDDRNINPDERDVCDGIDNNCDDQIDEDAQDQTYYADDDGDGFGDPGSSQDGCEAPVGYVSDDGDCNDRVAAINPAADELCDGIDNDCNGLTDDDATDGQVWYADRDSDGYGDPANTRTSCDQPSGYIANNTDCSDTDASAHPGATEICDGADNDCDSQIDEVGATGGTTWYADSDSDTFGNPNSSVTACTQPAGYVAGATDCDDNRATINPGAAEYCNSIDDDCDGTVDDNPVDATLWYQDSDSDSYGNPAQSQFTCAQPSGYVSNASDCNDAAAAIRPGATEVCDGRDNDCDGTVDQNATDDSTWYADSDSDGYGNSRTTLDSCNQPAGYVSNSTDCNDASASSYPGATEICDGRDNDCDGAVDDNAVGLALLADDADGDGFGDPGTTIEQCSGVDNELDCDDRDAGEPQVVDVINGSSGGVGTLTSPFSSIQDGIDAATACVVVYPGTYAESIDFGGKDIEVVSISGADDTVIDATGTGTPAVSFSGGETSAALLAGFTLSGGTGALDETSQSSACGSAATCTSYYQTYCGGGVYVDASSPSLTDLLFLNNVLPAAGTVTNGNDTYYTSSYGGGLCLMNSASIDASGLSFLFNYADQGGGIYVDSTSTLDLSNSTLQGNSATDGGGINHEGALTLTNVVNAFNSATGDGGGMITVDASLTLTNNVLAGSTGAALYLSGTSSSTGRNNIIYDATTYGVLADATASWTGTYNNVYGNTTSNYSGTANVTGVNGNISSVPGFTAYTDDGNFANDNFHLATGSSGINTGNPSAVYNDVDATRNDMGAYGGPGGGW